MAKSYRQAYGFFVGVDYELPAEYDGDPYRASDFGQIGAKNDVEALSRALAPALVGSKELTNERATRETILWKLEDTVQEARSGDLVIAYFRLHSVPKHPYEDLYLVPHGFEPRAVLATAVPYRLISAVLAHRMSLLILDVHGAAKVGFDMSRYRAGTESSLMVSCGPDEFSTKDEFPASDRSEKRLHGTFTWALVQALEDFRAREEGGGKRAWPVQLINWFDDAYQRVLEHTKKETLAGRVASQHPLFLGTLSPNLELRSRRATDERATPIEITAGSAT